jgi:hypothetical protein
MTLSEKQNKVFQEMLAIIKLTPFSVSDPRVSVQRGILLSWLIDQGQTYHQIERIFEDNGLSTEELINFHRNVILAQDEIRNGLALLTLQNLAGALLVQQVSTNTKAVFDN